MEFDDPQTQTVGRRFATKQTVCHNFVRTTGPAVVACRTPLSVEGQCPNRDEHLDSDLQE